MMTNVATTANTLRGHTSTAFAQKVVSLKGKVSDWSASAIKVSIKATGPRKGTGTVTVTGPLNQVEPDVAVWKIDWTVATTNTGTLKLTPQEA